MTDKERELAEIEKRTQDKKAAIEAKYAVLEALGTIGQGYKQPFIHAGQLYGTVGSINFQHDYFVYGEQKFKQPDPDLLRSLLASFPPVGKTAYKDGSRSFRPASTITHEMEEKAEDCLDICPVTVGLELYQHQTASFEWFATIAGNLWRFEVEFPLATADLGTLDLRYRRELGETIVDVCRFSPNHGAQSIRWPSGGSQYPNKFTLWWDVDTGKATDFPAIAQKSKAEGV
jgi:hypothetical protein